MNFYIAQGIGILVLIGAIFVPHLKKMYMILIGELLLNAMTMLQFILLDAFSGAILNLLGCIHAATITLCDKYVKNQSKLLKNVMFSVFLVLYIVASVAAFEYWYDVFPVVAAILFAFTLISSSTNRYNFLNVIKAIMWIVYSFPSRAYTMIPTQILLIASSTAAIVRSLKAKAKDVEPIEENAHS